MQVSVENTGTYERRMEIQVPAERVDQEVDSRLQSMAHTARIDGFRPGKVPVKVVKAKFGDQVRQEVVDSVVRATFQEALTQQQLKLAGEPKIEMPEAPKAGKALEYVVTFEVHPELPPVQLGGVSVERPKVEITDEDVAAVMEKLRKQRVAWDPVERHARKGDMLTISYEGEIDGKPFPGSSGTNVRLELGSEMVVSGFDDQLIGAEASGERNVVIEFPVDHPVKELAGNKANFSVKVLSVAEPRLPEMNDELAVSFGVAQGGVEALRNEVRQNMGRELDQALRMVVKEKVFDLLLQNNPVEVPAGLIDDEVKRLQALAAQQQEGAREGSGSGPDVTASARRRVALGLLVGRIVEDNGLQVDPARVRRMVEGIAASYENPTEVVAWYYDNPERLAEAQSSVLEDQVLEWIAEQVPTTEKPMAFDELMKMRQEAGN